MCERMIPNYRFEDETRIIWLKDVTAFPYVRETTYSWSVGIDTSDPVDGWSRSGRVLGYSRGFTADRYIGRCRVWWVKPHDRSEDPRGPYRDSAPGEAVMVASIRAGRPSLVHPQFCCCCEQARAS
ncbi:DUF6009 family protein [Streptomyces sp. NPDC047117]|uniref:DUF6009 family protein n=1 Tax=Streptomyces sp. NPDC047117 TaxID=3155379 RepID=UPI0033D62AB1